MSRPTMSMLPTLPEDVSVDHDIAPRVASHSDRVLMNKAASTGNLVDFEKMSKLFKPTSNIWEMRMFANANAYTNDHSRQFQICLQVANDMLLRKDGFNPTTKMQEVLTKIARSPQQKKTLADAIQSWSTHATHATHASDGGRPKMRRQILTRSRHRLNKSKKIRRRKVRRTRHRNRSYS